MKTLSTMLAERVESLLPHASAAGCVAPSHFCSSSCNPHGNPPSCFWIHRYCHVSCFGRHVTCGSWHTGRC